VVIAVLYVWHVHPLASLVLCVHILMCSKPGTSCLQLAAFRSLRCYNREEECPCDEVDGLLISNYRPTLPLGNRELRECAWA